MTKKLLLLILLPLFALATPFHTKAQIAEISSSVVKIYTTSVKPNYYRPWQKGSNTAASGTGGYHKRQYDTHRCACSK